MADIFRNKKAVLIRGHGLPVWSSSLNAYIVAQKSVTVSANDTLMLIPLNTYIVGWDSDPFVDDPTCYAIAVYYNVVGPGSAIIHGDPTGGGCDQTAEIFIVFPVSGTYTIRVLAIGCSIGTSTCFVDNLQNVGIEILGLIF